jgi:hypothetical protein
MLKGDKKKLMKYTDPKFNRPNPDAMAMGRAINLVKKDNDQEVVNEARTDLEREYSQYDSFTLNNRRYTIKDIEEYPGNRVQIITQPGSEIDPVTGDWERSKIFFSDKILKMGGEFHKKERKKRTTPAWNKGQKSTTKRQYERILKGAMRDAGGEGNEEFTYDMATSMIYDPEISSYLDKEYPYSSKVDKIQRLQSDLEMYLQESLNELIGYEGDEEYEDYKFIEPKKYIKTLLLDFDKIIKNPSLKQDKIKEFQNLTQVEYDYLKNIYDNIIPDLLEEYKSNSLRIRVFSILYDTLKYAYDFMTKYLREPIMEKKLTKAEKDKKEDIIMAMKKKKGGKKKLTDKDYAIATATAKKVAESAKEKSEKNYKTYHKNKDKNRLTNLIKDALKNPKKADLDKDGKLSDYEKKRGAAIEKTMLKEYTDDNFSGEELINRVNSEKPDELQADFIEEFFPNGFRSQQQAVQALRASDNSPIKRAMGQYAPMFVHVQFHEFTDQAGEKYGAHQTQYYNSNFKDKPGGKNFNPGVTQLYIYNRKTDQDIGTILVKTDEYVKDLELLRSRGQLGQRVSEASKGDEELEQLKKEAEKYNPKDIRYKEIQKKIYDLEYEKSYGLPGSKAAKKFDKSKLAEHILKKLRG